MALTQTSILLSNYDRVADLQHVTAIRATVDGPIRRSIGSSGDPVTLTVLATDWPVGWNELHDFWIIINSGQGKGSALTLKGYRLRMKIPASYGRDLGDPSGTVTPREYRLLLETSLRGLRDGLGNLITEGTLNELDEDNLVDTLHADYQTNQELVTTCLDAMGLDHEAAPASLNLAVDGTTTVDAPGPLDWGNARPIDEIDGLLSRIGWTIVQLNNGKIAVRRLRRAGEAITIPAPIAAVAEPYELGTMPAVRSSKIIVTSGATRSTIITSRSLEVDTPPAGINALEWCVFDAAQNTWGAQSGSALTTYQNGLMPGGVNPTAAKDLGQLYRAVRLTGDDLIKASMFVNIPHTLDQGDFAIFKGAAAVVEAKCAVKVGNDVLENVPDDDMGLAIRIDGVRAISGDGVFVLPPDAEFVRVDGLPSGRRGDVRELVGEELTITFAHESNTGDYTTDYFVVGFEWSITGPTITIDSMLPADVLLALEDPTVVKVGAPMLRRVMTLIEGDTEVPVSLNSDVLIEIAKKIAIARLSSNLAQSGVIELRGIIDINPGDIDGSVTSVAFDILGYRTLITINQHEVPRSFYERIQRISGESIASGIGALRLRRSSASLSDVRNTLTADDRTGGGSSNASPESNPSMRGRSRTMSGVQGVSDSGVKTRREMPTIIEQTTIYAQITSSISLGANLWEYDWEEVRFNAGLPVRTGATRTSTSHGKAYNTMEMLNTASGVQGNGVDIANLLGSFEIKPISTKAVVLLSGPFNDNDTPRWYFQAVNSVDGTCP